MSTILTSQIIINYIITFYLYFYGNIEYFRYMSILNVMILFMDINHNSIIQCIISFFILLNHRSAIFFCLNSVTLLSCYFLYTIHKKACKINDMLIQLDAYLIIDDDHINKIPKITRRRIINISNDNGLLNRICNAKRANIIINTNGGDADAANNSANNIMSHGNVYCYIPKNAKSAGSLLALACKNIYMHKYAALSPVDTIIDYKNNAYSVFCLKDHNDILIANTSNQIINHDRLMVSYLLKDKSNELLIELFSSGRLPHNCPFNYDFLKKSGLRVSSKLPNDVMDFYIQYREFYRYVKRFL